MTGERRGKPPTDVQVRWAGAQRFDVHRPGGPATRIDGDGATGPSPVATLLGALAACTAVDVVEILSKRRTPVESLAIEVIGQRADAVPSRVTHVTLHYRIAGALVEPAHAERAVELAVTKYCSVRDSLDPALPVEWRVTVNGAADGAR